MQQAHEATPHALPLHKSVGLSESKSEVAQSCPALRPHVL